MVNEVLIILLYLRLQGNAQKRRPPLLPFLPLSQITPEFRLCSSLERTRPYFPSHLPLLCRSLLLCIVCFCVCADVPRPLRTLFWQEKFHLLEHSFFDANGCFITLLVLRTSFSCPQESSPLPFNPASSTRFTHFSICSIHNSFPALLLFLSIASHPSLLQ